MNKVIAYLAGGPADGQTLQVPDNAIEIQIGDIVYRRTNMDTLQGAMIFEIPGKPTRLPERVRRRSFSLPGE